MSGAPQSGAGLPSSWNLDGGIHEIPLPADVPGRLWLCGKHLLGPDPDAVLTRVGASTIVCLVEEHELAQRYPTYVEWIGRWRGTRARWHPTPDLHAPPLDAMRRLADEIIEELRAGEGIVVHCGAGIGRAGTTAVAVLLRLGWSLDDALRHVGAHRPMAGPEVGAQRELVEALAAEQADQQQHGRPGA